MMTMKDLIKCNGYLKNYDNSIEILSDDYPLYLNKLCGYYGIPLNHKDRLNTIIAWDEVSTKYSFFYDFVNNEKSISSWLENSMLKDIEKIIIGFDYNLPIIKVETSIFIENWEDFVAASAFSGITCISENSNLFFEFTDDAFYTLYSNFPIKRE